MKIPTTWKNGTSLSFYEKLTMYLLRKAGCKCELPLIGSHLVGEIWLPRCRLCNKEYE